MPAELFTANHGTLRFGNDSGISTSKGDGVKPGDKASNAEARGTGGLGIDGGVGKGTPGPAVDPKQVEAAKLAAAQGDQSAIDWLKTMGLLGGGAAVLGGGKLLYDALKGRKPAPGVTDAEFAPVKPGTAVVPSDPKTQYLDWEEVPRQPRAQPLPAQPNRYLPPAEQKKLQGPPPASTAITQQDGARNPVGPTNRQREETTAYLQKGAQDAKAAKIAKDTGRAAKAARMQEMAKAIRRLRL